jgi:peptidyl-prolyl cis-trans isomerase A (cyclophilin A)
VVNYLGLLFFSKRSQKLRFLHYSNIVKNELSYRCFKCQNGLHLIFITLTEKAMIKKLSFLVLAFVLMHCKSATNPKVIITTSLGDITIEVMVDKAPITANNFLAYIDSGKYHGIATFYRVVRLDNQPNSKTPIQVIQGGFFHDSLVEKYQYPPIPHEHTGITGLTHTDGVISMARYGPGTASSEFFICIEDNKSLDYNGTRNPDLQGFSAFGRVVKGMEIVRKIQLLPDTNQYLVNQVIITNTRRIY